MLKEITNYIYRLRLIDFWGVLFMSSWKQILEENKAIGSPFDVTGENISIFFIKNTRGMS